MLGGPQSHLQPVPGLPGGRCKSSPRVISLVFAAFSWRTCSIAAASLGYAFSALPLPPMEATKNYFGLDQEGGEATGEDGVKRKIPPRLPLPPGMRPPPHMMRGPPPMGMSMRGHPYMMMRGPHPGNAVSSLADFLCGFLLNS